MMKIGTQVLALLSALCTLTGVAFAANPMDAGPEVVRGAWCSDFTASKTVADRDNVPMLVFWANPGCSHCEKLEAACKKEDFKAWQAERQLVMVFGYGKATADTAACKEFAKNSSGQFPYMAVYWKANTDGVAVLERFSGLSGQMMGADAAQPLQKQLMDAVDAVLTDWNPDPEEPMIVGGSFLVPDVEGSRLEAIAGRTQAVEVPLVRTNATCAVVNELVVDGVTNEVSWAIGESEKSVWVDTSALSVGSNLLLELYQDGELKEVSAIHGVTAPPNACSNPKFLGEEFEYGEWTFDYAAAKAKVATDPEAHLVVTFSGPLWCPYCKGIESTLLETEAFKTWARENKVALVLMEQGRATSPATALGQRGPRLTTYDPDPNKVASGEIVSGAAYRSRLGVTEDQARFLINQAAAYTAKWLEPGTTAARLGNPTILLVDPVSEKVNARFNGYREDKVYDVAENLQRLDAFLAKAGANEADKYPLTTTLVHEVGKAEAVALDVIDTSRSYVLDTKPGLVSVSLTPAGSQVFKLTLYCGATAIATGANAVSAVVTSGQIATGIALKVSASFGRGERTASGAFASTWTAVSSENVYAKAVFSRTMALTDDAQTLGTLTLLNSHRGKCSLRYFDARSGKTLSMSGTWSEPDEVGTVRLAIAKQKNKVVCGLELTSDGEVSACIRDVRLAADAPDLFGTAYATAIDYAQYAGTVYTVALPVDWAEPTLFSGAGHIVVRANAKTVAKNGKVACKVTLPNGVTRSLTAQLEPGANAFANLTVCVRNGKETLIAPMKIRPNAILAPTHRAIVAQEGCDAHWMTRDTKLPYAVSCGIYGSRYDKNESLIDCCGTDRLVLLCDHTDLVMGYSYPEIAAVVGNNEAVTVTDKSIKLAQKIKGASLTYSRTYGTVGGKVKFILKNGKTLAAKLSGIIFHDWHDCGCFDEDDGLPLSRDLAIVLGTCTFTDRVNGRSLTRGIPFMLVPKE